MFFQNVVLRLLIVYGSFLISEGNVEAPKIEGYPCGYTFYLPLYFGNIANDSHNYPIYYLNTTANKLISEGFEVTVNEVFEDVLSNFTYSNGSYTNEIAFSSHGAISGSIPEPTTQVRSFYMAQLGTKEDESIKWSCDGVLINRQWVLTAAHCFFTPFQSPNLVRLGDYNSNEPVEEGTRFSGKFINDYPISEVIIHPDFKVDQSYHDLALIKLPKASPRFSSFINPICLPWGKHSNKNLTEEKLILTGWGVLRNESARPTVMQEAILKAFETSLCDQTYSDVPSFWEKYPNGVTFEDTLCIGRQDGSHACEGNSGAPVVYQEDGKVHGRFILAGILSGGQKCGLESHPGLYIPINKPKYLLWIRETAFQDNSRLHERSDAA